MYKNIVLFSDGTGNSSASVLKTNVYRLYDALDRSLEKSQVAFYDDGVGTSSFKPLAVLGGAFGFGLKRNVLELYKFLSREYHKAQANGCTPRIACFGFSRGAYTIRVLLALIESQGLLPDDGEAANLDRWAALAYEDFRKESAAKMPLYGFRFATIFAWLRDSLFARRRRNYDPTKNIRDSISIDFLGLWDTVGAYGMPVAELERAIDKFLFSFRFGSEEKLPSNVRVARHALSLDDERDSFTPILFDERGVDRSKQDLVQLWFAGMHANVGGGYPDDTMSYAPLHWIMLEAQAAGIQFRREAVQEIGEKATSFGKMYDSRAGFGGLYRYKPRNIDELLNPGATPADDGKPVAPLLHESAIRRLAAGFDGYSPIALPKTFALADAKGRVLHEFFSRSENEETVTAAPANRSAKAFASDIQRIGVRITERMGLIQSAVFWRQVLYQFTLIPVVLLIFLPLYDIFAEPDTKSEELAAAADKGWGAAGRDYIGAALEPLIPDQMESALKSVGSAILLTVNLLKDLVVWLWGLALTLAPSWAQTWPKCFQQHPGLTLGLTAVAVGCYLGGGRLKRYIDDRSRAIWGRSSLGLSWIEGRWDQFALWATNSALLKWLWNTIVINAIPAVIAVFIGPFIVLAAFDRAAFQLESYYGLVCRGDGERLQTGEAKSFEFYSSNPCAASGVHIERGKSYLLSIKLNNWGEKGRNATLSGFDHRAAGFWPKFGSLLATPISKRMLGPKWFATIVRVGDTGVNRMPVLSGENTEASAESEKDRDACTNGLKTKRQKEADGQTEILLTAGCDVEGQLFLYVNDGYNGFLPSGWLVDGKGGSSWRNTYGNNDGVASVTVKSLPDAPTGPIFAGPGLPTMWCLGSLNPSTTW